MAVRSRCRWGSMFSIFTKTQRRRLSIFSNGDAADRASAAWQKAMADAEKLVGFPTSFLSLRALLSEDFGGLAVHLRKLINTKHPLLTTAKDIVFASKTHMQTRGLIVLLLSKAANPDFEYNFKENSSSTEIFNKQKALAEVTELIHLAFLVHRGIVNASDINKQISKADASFGNRLAVLGGDFMLANACLGLAKLENTEVVDLISAAIRDMSMAVVTLPESGASFHPTSLQLFPVGSSEWDKVMRLSNSSLLSNACHASLLLASSDKPLIKAAKNFADHLILARRARDDIVRFHSVKTLECSPNFSCLSTLPVAIMCEKHGGIDFLENFTKENDDGNLTVDATSVYKAVTQDQDSLDLSRKYCNSIVNTTLQTLDPFPDSEAKTVLKNIVVSVQ